MCFKELSILEIDEKQMKYPLKLPQGLSKIPGHYFYAHLIVHNFTTFVKCPWKMKDVKS